MTLRDLLELSVLSIKVSVRKEDWEDDINGMLGTPEFDEAIVNYLDNKVTGYEIEATDEIVIYIQ